MKHLADLPNSEGFLFVGIDKEGNRHECQVRKNPIGCLGAYRTDDGEPFFMRLAGWESITPRADAKEATKVAA